MQKYWKSYDASGRCLGHVLRVSSHERALRIAKRQWPDTATVELDFVQPTDWQAWRQNAKSLIGLGAFVVGILVVAGIMDALGREVVVGIFIGLFVAAYLNSKLSK